MRLWECNEMQLRTLNEVVVTVKARYMQLKIVN